MEQPLRNAFEYLGSKEVASKIFKCNAEKVLSDIIIDLLIEVVSPYGFGKRDPGYRVADSVARTEILFISTTIESNTRYLWLLSPVLMT